MGSPKVAPTTIPHSLHPRRSCRYTSVGTPAARSSAGCCSSCRQPTSSTPSPCPPWQLRCPATQTAGACRGALSTESSGGAAGRGRRWHPCRQARPLTSPLQHNFRYSRGGLAESAFYTQAANALLPPIWTLLNPADALRSQLLARAARTQARAAASRHAFCPRCLASLAMRVNLKM